MRVTPITVANDIIYNLENTYSTIETMDKQLSSGKQILLPSDNPAGTAYAIDLQSSIDHNQQYQQSSQSALSWMQSTTSALQNLSNVAMRARTLAVQGANDTNTPTDRQALAKEVTQLTQQAVQISNTTFGTESLFAGSQVLTTPFNAQGGYAGDTGALTHQIAPGYNMRVNVDPTTVFTGTSGIFHTLQQLTQHLNSSPVLQPTQNGGTEAMNLTGVYAGAPTDYTVQVTGVSATGQVTGLQYSTTGGAPWTPVVGAGSPPTFALGSGMTGSFTNGAVTPQVGDQFTFHASGAVNSATFAMNGAQNIGNEQVTLTGSANQAAIIKPAELDANNNIIGVQVSTDGGVTFSPTIKANEVQPSNETMSYTALTFPGPTANYLVRVASAAGGVATAVVASTDNGATWSAPIAGVGSPPQFAIDPNISVGFDAGAAQVGDQFATAVASASTGVAIAGTSALNFPTTTTFTGSNGLAFSVAQSTVNAGLVIANHDAFTYTPPTTSLSSDLTALDAVIANLSGQQAQLGAQTNSVQNNTSQLQSLKEMLQTTLSQTADADIAAVTTRLTTANTVYQAALAVDARSIQPSLVSFLH
jgi:flagellin-like hook-associated protein FlgL